jgi:hypothetical protein
MWPSRSRGYLRTGQQSRPPTLEDFAYPPLITLSRVSRAGLILQRLKGLILHSCIRLPSPPPVKVQGLVVAWAEASDRSRTRGAAAVP